MKVKKYLFFIIIVSTLFYTSKSLLEDSENKEREDTIYINAKINEIFASTEIIQYFSNPLEKPIELLISFPLKENINLNKFIISLGEQTIASKVLNKEEAEEKYDYSIYSGNTGFLSKYEDDMKNYVVNIGNVEPREKVKLHAFFIQKLGANDMSYEYEIMEKYPTFHYKQLNQEGARNKIIKANFKVETQSKITRLIAPFYDEEAKKKSKLEVSFSNDYKLADIKYTKNPYDQKNKDFIDNGAQSGYPGKVNAPTYLTSFSILFRCKNMNKPHLYYQHNNELNETSYVLNYIYSSKKLMDIPIPETPDQNNKVSYYQEYQKNIINNSPGLFIFLIDQSGSMRGKSISLVKQALLLFIQSLPKNSYFQLIGFGTDFKKYNQVPVEYNEENVAQIINIIKQLDADFGGTNIVSPLSAIYNEKVYDKIKLSKNIFLLTDGQIYDRDECVKLITANSDKFRIHAIGIGDYFDKILIERSGKLSKGSSVFVKNVEQIKSAVINALNKGLRDYLIDLKFNFIQHEEKIKNSIITLNPKDDFSYQDEIITFSFILDDKNKIDIDKLNENIKLQITGKNSLDLINEIIILKKNDNMIKLSDGNELSKVIVGQGLKYNKELNSNKNKEILFSKKYQILSKNTALYAEITKFNDSQQKKLITVDLDKYIQYNFKDNVLLDVKIPTFSEKSSEQISDYLIIGTANSKRSFVRDTPEYNKLSFSHVKLTQVDEANSMSNNEEDLLNECNNNNIIEEFKAGSENNNNDNELIKLIMTQNILEGFWDENDETKMLIQILPNNKIMEIEKKIKNLNINEENKIKYTIIVLFYLEYKYKDKLDEFKLIINKANKFLNNHGIKYEDIINEKK